MFVLFVNVSSFLSLPLVRYESEQILRDTDFTNGFTVVSQKTDGASQIRLGDFTYNDRDEAPSWTIAQWNSGPCLWKDRKDSDKYTLTDGVTKTVVYDPTEKSVSLRLNAANVYGGAPAGEDNWPHLLLEQSPISIEDSSRCDADRIIMDLDIRLSDFVDTLNPDGINAVQFLAYFYMRGVESDDFIWFGVNLFDSRGYQETMWQQDTVGGLMIYCLSTKDTYAFSSGSLFKKDKPNTSDRWVHLSIDLTDHIDKVIEKANKDNTFGKEVSKEDFYIAGTNIGFEIHGNYDCTVDIKDFTLTAYNK